LGWRDFAQYREFERNFDSGLWGLHFVWRDWQVSFKIGAAWGDFGGVLGGRKELQRLEELVECL